MQQLRSPHSIIWQIAKSRRLKVPCYTFPYFVTHFQLLYPFFTLCYLSQFCCSYRIYQTIFYSVQTHFSSSESRECNGGERASSMWRQELKTNYEWTPLLRASALLSPSPFLSSLLLICRHGVERSYLLHPIGYLLVLFLLYYYFITTLPFPQTHTEHLTSSPFLFLATTVSSHYFHTMLLRSAPSSSLRCCHD